VIADLVVQDVGVRIEFNPQQWGDADGRTSYVVVLPAPEAAVAVVAAVNGRDATDFPSLVKWSRSSQCSLQGVRVGVCFVSDDAAQEAFMDDEDDFGLGNFDSEDFGLGARSKTAP